MRMIMMVMIAVVMMCAMPPTLMTMVVIVMIIRMIMVTAVGLTTLRVGASSGGRPFAASTCGTHQSTSNCFTRISSPAVTWS